MLARTEAESVFQLFRDFEPDRVGLVSFGHDFSDPELVEMLGHQPTTARRDRCGAGTASLPTNGRDARYDGRGGRPESDAGPKERPAWLQPVWQSGPSDTPPRTCADRLQCRDRSILPVARRLRTVRE